MNMMLIHHELFYIAQHEEILNYNPTYPTPPLRQDMTQGQFLSGV